MLYQLFKKIIFLFPAEFSHKLTLSTLDVLNNLKILPLISPKPIQDKFTFKGVKFKNKVGLSAGLDKDADHINVFATLGFGFIEVGTVTPKPQKGNDKPRLFRVVENEALINRFGFNNKGIDHLVLNVKKLGKKDFALGINIGKNKNTPEDEAYKDYEICLEKCYQYADYITINISSPNTAGLRDLQKKDNLSHLLEKIDTKRKELAQKHNKAVPIFVKIAPDITDEEIIDISDVIIQQNMDGVILTNTTIDKTLLGQNSKHLETVGGLSGKPLFTNSTQVLEKFKQKLNADILVIGVGGIDSPEKAQEKIHHGADLVQIYTGLIYQGPSLISKSAQALKR